MSTTFETYRIASVNETRSGTSAKGNAWTMHRVVLVAPAQADGPAPCIVADTFETVPPVGSVVGVVIEVRKKMIGNDLRTDYNAVAFTPVA